jgi:hypothetical protein
MKLRKNRRVERAGVNAVQAFFEKHDWIFQSIDLENDYGKDAYVDAPNGNNATGVCAALQIKSGASFRRANGYAIPIGEHERIWRESVLPIMGIVHDPNNEGLYWCDISSFLRDHPNGVPASIPLSRDNVLNANTLTNAFLPSIRQTAGTMGESWSPLDLCSESIDRQVAAIHNAFALAAIDPRGMILVRRLLISFEEDALFAAIHLMPQVERHSATASTITKTFRWNVMEILHLLTRVGWERWQRGDIGSAVYALLIKDPDYEAKVRTTLDRAMESDLPDAAWAATYLLVYWAGEDGRRIYEELVEAHPKIRGLPLANELECILGDFECTELF